MSCRRLRRHGDDDTSSRTCRCRVKKTTCRANTSDKTTTLSAENASKYIDFNIKRVTKDIVWSRRAVDKKDTFPRRNNVVHCTETRKLNAEMATCHTKVLCTTAFLRRHRLRDVMPSATLRWWGRRVDDDTSSCQEGQHVAQSLLTNDSLIAVVVDLFILLTPLHSTTFKN